MGAVVVWGLLAMGAGAAETVGEQVKGLATRYGLVEEQLGWAVRCEKRQAVEGGALVKRAWFDGVGDLLKVATERTGPQGREVTEYTGVDPELFYNGMFVFSRTEKPEQDGATVVEETRRYYGQVMGPDRFGRKAADTGVLIRELRKSARFAAGEPLELGKTPNATTVLPKPAELPVSDEVQKARWDFFQGPEEMARELRKGRQEGRPPSQAGSPPSEETGGPTSEKAGSPTSEVKVFDPFAGVVGDSERYRLIQGSASLDGRYAFAIGFDQPVDWDTYAGDPVEGREIWTADGEEGLRNFVVDLATRRILGVTGCTYFGTRRRYNHRQTYSEWSDDSRTFVAQFDSKWSYESCQMGRIGPGPKLVGTVDLGAAAEKHAQSFLKNKRRKYDGSIALTVLELKNDGTIVLEVVGQSPSGSNKGEVYFTLEETLRLQEKAGKLHLALLKTRLRPNP